MGAPCTPGTLQMSHITGSGSSCCTMAAGQPPARGSGWKSLVGIAVMKMCNGVRCCPHGWDGLTLLPVSGEPGSGQGAWVVLCFAGLNERGEALLAQPMGAG